MSNLAQPILRNTRLVARHERILRLILRILNGHFFVFDIFAPVGALLLIREMSFTTGEARSHSLYPVRSSNILKEEFAK